MDPDIKSPLSTWKMTLKRPETDDTSQGGTVPRLATTQRFGAALTPSHGDEGRGKFALPKFGVE